MAPMNHLIVFTRYPQPGKTKTRLISSLGAEGAAALQRQMTDYTMRQVKALLEVQSVSVEIWFAGDQAPEEQSSEIAQRDRQLMQSWLGSEWVYQSQSPGDLGARMAEAFQAAFAAGMKQVMTIGTDCPGLDAGKMAQAFRALQDHDLVLGPATDGGYYLIGLRQFFPALFAEIAWGTSEVFQKTVEIAQSLGLAIARLDPLTDVDRPADIPVWQAVLAQSGLKIVSASPCASIPIAIPLPRSISVSIIIPVLNEAATIQAGLSNLQLRQTTETADTIEVIVVDGGSQDETVTLATALGAKVIISASGRANQMNAGAKLATGEILLFLHIDTCLPDEFVPLLQQTLAQPETIAGAFELRIAGEKPALRLVEWGVKWRSRLFQLPYGDQAIFLKATTFHQLGGFPELPIMEDFEFVRRLRAKGRIAIAPANVITSGRRWENLGVLKTTLINQLAIAAYFVGISPERIARWYRTTHRR